MLAGMASHQWRQIATKAGAIATGTLLAVALAAPGQAAARQRTSAPEPSSSATPGSGLDRQALRRSLDAAHEAGMYGIYSEVRDGRQTWQGASGVADVDTRRPVRPDMVHRIGSITKTFTAVAVLQQVARGTVDLDAPIARYLPELVPGERGQQITVRMLLNHTSHIADYVGPAFPSLLEGTTSSLDEHRFRTIAPEELVRLGLAATPTGQPGATPGMYSNTNYVVAGLLLEKVTGVDAEQYITRHVIRKAGLRHTSFPRTARIPGPHSKAYESWYGLIDPPRDYSVYDMSWASTAGAMVSTMSDLNQFYRALLQGELIGAAQLAEMQKTVLVSLGGGQAAYGLGIYSVDLPCGRFWGHDGGVFGMGTQSLVSADGGRLLSFGMNLMKYQRFDESGQPVPNEIDQAIWEHLFLAVCGQSAGATAKSAQPSFVPSAADRMLVKR
jgi:D-alanyl-D-alanine carboxypeptidase